MSEQTSRSRLIALLVILALLGLWLGWLWATLWGQFGPTPREQGLRLTALDGAVMVRDRGWQFWNQRAVDGRILLMPFQAFLWDSDDENVTVERIETHVFIHGLSHVDVVADMTDHSRVLFRLSRLDAVPSGLILQRDGVMVAMAPASGEWTVPQDIVDPEMRGRLQQVSFFGPQTAMDEVAEALDAAWFDLEVERRGNRFIACVNGQEVAGLAVEDVPPGEWGIAGGDLPFSHTDRIALAGTERVHGQEMAWSRTIDFPSRLGAMGRHILATVIVAGVAVGLILILSTAAWGMAPGLPWGLWLQRTLWCMLPLIAIPLHDLRADTHQHPGSLVGSLRLSLIGAGAVWWLLLTATGAQWRCRAHRLERTSLVAALRHNRRSLGIWLSLPLVMSLALSVVGLVYEIRRDRSLPPPPEPIEEVLVNDVTPIERGDVLSTGNDRLGDGEFEVALEAIDAPTTVEILAHWRGHLFETVPDWIAVRLSTEEGVSAHLNSDSLDPPTPIAIQLRPGDITVFKITVEGDRYTLAAQGSEIATWRDDTYRSGRFGVVVCEGHARVHGARAIGRYVEPGPDPGTRPFPSRPLMMALGLLIVFGGGWLLASWFGVEARPLVCHLALVTVIALLVWRQVGIWWLEQPHTDYTHRAPYALCWALLIFLPGVYLWIAGQWRHLRRRLLPSLLILISLLATVEAAMRAHPGRWGYVVDFQGGYIRDTLLMHPMLAKMLWQSESGDLESRENRPRPRADGDETIRIIALGGSAVYGSGVPEASQAWPALLESDLTAEGRSVEVYNFGVESMTAFDAVSYLERDLLTLDPDWVVISVGGNDAKAQQGNPPPQRARWEALQEMTPFQRRMRRFMTRTVSLVALNRLLTRTGGSMVDQFEHPQHPAEDLLQTLNELCDLGEEHGFGVVLVDEPIWESIVFDETTHEPWYDAMEEIAHERGAVHIDPRPIFREHLEDDIWTTWIHPNDLGNRLMADALIGPLREAIDGSD